MGTPESTRLSKGFPFPETAHYIANVPLEGWAFTWQVTIHDSGRDITSPEFKTHAEMSQWESDWYEHNAVR